MLMLLETISLEGLHNNAKVNSEEIANIFIVSSMQGIYFLSSKEV